MKKAVWKGYTVAESENTVFLEGNHYFPPEGVKHEFLVPSDYRTTCPWKGEAHYYSLAVDGETNENAAWSYPEPKEKARAIKNHFAFWKGVTVEDDSA